MRSTVANVNTVHNNKLASPRSISHHGVSDQCPAASEAAETGMLPANADPAAMPGTRPTLGIAPPAHTAAGMDAFVRAPSKWDGLIRRPTGEYGFFCLKHTPAVKIHNPDLTPMELSKKLGIMWHDTTKEERKHYQHKATADKTRYRAEVAADAARKKAATQYVDSDDYSEDEVVDSNFP